MTKRVAIMAVVWLVFAGACGEDGGSQPRDAAVDGSGPPDASCFENPQTHEQIINACTSAQQIFKTPVLPLLRPDGTLPPLPP